MNERNKIFRILRSLKKPDGMEKERIKNTLNKADVLWHESVNIVRDYITEHGEDFGQNHEKFIACTDIDMFATRNYSGSTLEVEYINLETESGRLYYTLDGAVDKDITDSYEDLGLLLKIVAALENYADGDKRSVYFDEDGKYIGPESEYDDNGIDTRTGREFHR